MFYLKSFVKITQSKMSDLGAEITELKLEIKDYQTRMNAATTEKEIDRYAELIICTRNTLNLILKPSIEGAYITTLHLLVAMFYKNKYLYKN